MKGKFVITKLYENGIEGYYETIIGLKFCEDSSCIKMEEKKISFNYQPSSQTISISDDANYEEAKEVATQLKDLIYLQHVKIPALLYKNEFYNL